MADIFAQDDDAAGVAEYLAALKASDRFGAMVAHHQEIPGSPAIYAEPETPLPPPLRAALAAQGVARLYCHQAEALDLIARGRDVVVATPTASGKSLIYNLPVFAEIMKGDGAKALYLFPLKALAQDQLRAVGDLAARLPADLRPRGAICDGDTSSHFRRKIRENPPDILFTNPDMLHLSLLGYHDRWGALWPRLTHVVIDEVHTYRGIFGSHMAWVLRRLIRICRHYGSEPRFILSSATIGNPGELAGALLDREVAVVTEGGAPRGGRHFLFVDPLDSAAFTASQLLEAALRRGLRTIVYTQSRKMTELVSVWTGARLDDQRHRLTAYRAGFLPEERREIEAKLASGELLGVVSTSALELGIDIGELDICILLGYPGTVMATWQRGGRVGRRQRDSLVILVGQEDALDQYFLRHPADFFNRPVEKAVLNPANRQIMKQHLLCAAAELPLLPDSELLTGAEARAALAELRDSGELLQGSEDGRWFTSRKYPHRHVDLRGSGRPFAIRNDLDNTLLGEIDGIRCLKECHPGAVYLHRGRTWVVNRLDLEGREVRALEKKVHYFTRPQASKETEILEVRRRLTCVGSPGGRTFTVGLGRLRVTDTVTGFKRILVKGQRVIGVERLDLPPTVFETEGLWIEIPDRIRQGMEREQLHFMGGIHAVEHGLIGIFPLLVLCDRNDVGGIAYPYHPQLEQPAVFIYDGQPGGVGLCREAVDRIGELLQAGLDTITACPCEVGCPSCVHSPKCGSGNRPIDKAAALRVLGELLGRQGRLSEQRLEYVAPAPVPLVAGKEPRLEAVGSSGPALAAEGEGETLVAPARPARFGIFDVETKRSAAEVGGWHQAEKMGISIAVLYDSGPDEFIVYRDDELDRMIARFKELDLVVGFNNKRFDNLVLSAYTSFALDTLPTLDILEKVKNRLGYRLSLDHLAEQTLGIKKSGDGLQALKWYKEGRLDLIIQYCRQDVEITRDLFLYGLENGHLLFRNKAGCQVRCPVEFGF
jgi:DEAD/DEAH box helicase domain-containing protein